MNKLLIASLLLSLSTVHLANAQVEKGNKVIGGNMGLHTTHDDLFDDNELNFFISPRFGYGLSKNWVIGADLQYRYGQAKSGDVTTKKANMLGPAIFARKFYPVNDHLGFFGEAVAFYGFGDSTLHYLGGGGMETEKWKMQQYSISVHPGIYFKPTKAFLVEASIGNISYTNTKSTWPDGTKPRTKEFDISFINNLSFGFFFVFQ